MAIEGEMGEGKLWDYDLHVNDNQVPSPFVFHSGESSRSQLLGSSSGVEGHSPLDHQLLTDYDFSSFLEAFEKDYEQNPESHLAPNPSMVNHHSSSSEENPIARGNSTTTPEEIPSKNSSVHDLVSPFQETGMMDYIPPFVEDDAVMAESASYSSLVHQIASLSEEEFQDIVMKSNMVDDHVDSSNESNVAMEEAVPTPKIQSPDEGNVTMEETMPNPVTLGENGVPHERYMHA